MAKGVKLSEIARRLLRSKSNISDESDEVKRNSRWDKEKETWTYEAIYAQEETDKRMVDRRKQPQLKNKLIYSYVVDHLRDGWSPEQIEGRLKLDFKEELSSTRFFDNFF